MVFALLVRTLGAFSQWETSVIQERPNEQPLACWADVSKLTESGRATTVRCAEQGGF